MESENHNFERPILEALRYFKDLRPFPPPLPYNINLWNNYLLNFCNIDGIKDPFFGIMEGT